ncbi:MAG: hypothetical protein RLN72_00250 [Henriciella sp.]
MVVLSHPDILGHKYEFAEGFIEHVKPFAWIGTVSEFGDWWAARDRVGVDVDASESGVIIELSCPTPINGLTLNVPVSYGAPAKAEGGTIVTAAAGKWLVNCSGSKMRIPARSEFSRPTN